MNYDTLEAGREMDALVAEKVIGLVLSYSEDGMQRYDTRTEGDTEMWLENVPDYSTSISAAWEVVEKMAGDMRIDKYASGGYRVEYFNKDGDGGDCTAPTAPLAICRAALAALKEGK